MLEGNKNYNFSCSYIIERVLNGLTIQLIEWDTFTLFKLKNFRFFSVFLRVFCVSVVQSFL